jgi:hypothetical protein
MVLLSQMMRTAAITGSTDYALFPRIAGRQGGAWAQRTVGAAMPTGQSRNDGGDVRLRDLADLHARGVLTDAEFERFRSRLRL